MSRSPPKATKEKLFGAQMLSSCYLAAAMEEATRGTLAQEGEFHSTFREVAIKVNFTSLHVGHRS